ncbi:flagellar protein [Microvirga tunisiensis]|uniref:Flagellar protein n=2 Tax=Pannonibacter tanglangensis TaxID=2750084 RepID=A0ABW9ZPH2_9HYPH|nr:MULTISPECIES: flagellar basal body-associated FliL family protein [unclassified Pannonibacter]NBN64874.1 flagellar protein [Pannonibacter sp. XCT-34]NBN79377.1 flagellar protein [Pannonibacter sp. XCT-53]
MSDSGFSSSGRGPTGASLFGSLVILTLLAAGVGALAGMHLADTVRRSVNAEAAATPAPAAPVYPALSRLRQLKPLVTNLAAPKDAWIRVQASIILDESDIDDPGILAGHIEEDILAYLRTITLEHVEGAAGLQHLREDLNERAITRSGGKVRELILESLVVQ